MNVRWRIKRSLQALDGTIKDLRNNQNKFGGVMILLSSDFRQTLSVVPHSTNADEMNGLNACLINPPICGNMSRYYI